MVLSRLSRVEEKKASRRIAIAILGTLGLLVFVAVFGLKLLVGFSLFVDRIRGGAPAPQPQQALILPPVLDPLPEATNSATLTIHGRGTAKLQVILYVNDKEYKKLPVDDNGSFQVERIPVDEGLVTVSAKLLGDNNAISDLSNVTTTTVDRTAPKLIVNTPADGTTINDGTHKTMVTGITDDDMKVIINGRIVVLKSDGSFSYGIPLNDGENKLSVISKDMAGNETKIERTVTYQP